jgi:hypothetical protein
MKNVFYYVVCCIAVLAVISCGEKKVVGADGKEYYSVEDACRNHDFEAAYQFAEKFDQSLLGGVNKKELSRHRDYIFNQEMLYLVSLNTPEATNRVVYLLAEFNIEGTPVGENQTYFYPVERDPAKEYIASIIKYNERCNSILDLAISLGNEELAKKIIDLYKKDIEILSDYAEGGVFGDEELKTGKYVETSKQAAKEKLEKAIKEGKFNNKEEQ